MDINLYPEMNRKIVNILRISEDNSMNLYAAALIERLTAEKDAAINDMDEVAEGRACIVCSKNPDNCGSGLVGSCAIFEWRGLQSEDTEVN